VNDGGWQVTGLDNPTELIRGHRADPEVCIMQGESPWLDRSLSGLYGRVFVAEETPLAVSFGTARNRLARLVRTGTLLAASRDAYDRQTRQLTRVGPFGGAPGLSRLVEVELGDLVTRSASEVLPLRWRATGRSGGLFPTLDADLLLSPKGEEASLLGLNGVYRPPLGPVGAALDEVLLTQVAVATIQAFLHGLADTIAGEPSARR
jgi:hypothetical protein